MKTTNLILFMLLIVANLSCGEAEEMNKVDKLFRAELTKRGVTFSGPNSEGLYAVMAEEGERTISLYNLQRSFDRDRDPEAVARFVGFVLKPLSLPPWEKAKGLVCYSAEPSGSDFGDTLHAKVSDGVTKIITLTDISEGTVTWLTSACLAEWEVTREQLESAANDNLSRLLDGKQLETTEVDGMHLGMVPVDSPYKASIIFSAGFKRFVSTELGWPVLVTIPCRDFIYVISEKDKALLERMGKVVQSEYRESAYPITTEVLRISDDGIEAIGEFPK